MEKGTLESIPFECEGSATRCKNWSLNPFGQNDNPTEAQQK